MIGFALLAALGYGASDFIGGAAARRTSPISVLRRSYPAGFVLSLFLLPMFPGTISVGQSASAALAGACGLAGLALLYRLMARAALSIVCPLSAVVAALVPVVVGVARGESLGLPAAVGISLGAAAIALITRSCAASGPVSPIVLMLAAASGLALGAYFVLISRGGAGSGLWPLAVARGTATVILLGARPGSARVAGGGTQPATNGPCAAVERCASVPVAGGPAVAGGSAVGGGPAGKGGAAVLTGLTDAAADVFFVLAATRGPLSLTAMLTGLYPAVTVLLALAFFGERCGPAQRVGLAMTPIALALMIG